MPHRLAAPLVCALALVAGCATDVTVDDGLSPVVVTELDRAFEDAARASGVPPDLLKAIGYVETRWQMVAGEEEHDGVAPGVGVMALRPEAAARGAALAGVSVEEVREDAAANIRAAAMLLAEEARAQGVSGADLAAWVSVVAAWSGIEDPDAVAQYVHGDVYGVLAAGAEARAESGEMIATLAPHKELAALAPAVPKAGTDDYPAAVWRPSPNYNARPAGTRVSHVVIHTCEGNYAGCWGWMRNAAAQVSAHYVVNESGSEITQLVREAHRAWHVGASYDCARNGNTDCAKNGQSVNNFSIGIEHGGFASQASFPAGQIEASARLTCDITRSHGIPRDRYHIVSHGQLQPWNRTDPGPNWPWAHYLDRIRALCGDGGTTPPPTGATILVDSNNANNNAAVARIELRGTWTSANASPGYYGTGYWWAPTEPVSAPATFWFYLPSAQSRAIDAWWVAGSNRTTSATFMARNAADVEVGRATRNQQVQGSQWVNLGTWSFSAGWNKVVLSRWVDDDKVVIADAIRIR